jgi:xylulokinase
MPEILRALLGIDAGTTHCKAGVFALDGALLGFASLPAPVTRPEHGAPYYDPEAYWRAVLEAITKAVEGSSAVEIAALGVASMAETGLLVDRRTGAPRTHLLPWFDRSAEARAELLLNLGNPEQRFCLSGIHPTFKTPLAKILHLREHQPELLDDALWLNTADYLVYRLTEEFATDPSLAGRTYAFRLDCQKRDTAWLKFLGLPEDLFPNILPSGAPAGSLRASLPGVAQGIPVAVCGHDHVCATFAVHASDPGVAFNSLGTAQTLTGTFPARPLTSEDYRSGFLFGCHIMAGQYYWMGSLSASGGSIEWLRSILGGTSSGYEEWIALAESALSGPGEVLYYPYLSGISGAPAALGAFLGLQIGHSRADLLKAVLEGTAYELENLRRSARDLLGQPIDRMVAAGGGVRFTPWLQIQADVTGIPIEARQMPEVTLLGTALSAGIGAGLYRDQSEAVAELRPAETLTYVPNPARHAQYQAAYEGRYLKLRDLIIQAGPLLRGEHR